MKTQIYLRNIAILVTLIATDAFPAMGAITKCINLQTNNCTADAFPSVYTGRGEWSATCNNISIHGITAYGKSGGVSQGGATSSIKLTTDTSIGVCWCKMTRPVESQWVQAGKNSDILQCSAFCQQMISNECRQGTPCRSFQANIINNLYD